MSSPHASFNPDSLPQPRGYSHAIVAAAGRVVAIAGQIGCDERGEVTSDSLAEQFDRAAANLARALEAAGAEPSQVISLQIFTTDVEGYKAAAREIGEAYRRHFGRHYPAMGLFGVSELYDPRAKVELMALAVVPDELQGAR